MNWREPPCEGEHLDATGQLPAPRSSRQRRYLPLHRQRLYQAIVRERRPTPLLSIEGSDARALVDDRIFSWRLPWRVPRGQRLLLKLEHLTDYNPSGSLYDRVYPYLFHDFERRGLIAPGASGTPVIECSAGNAAAAFCNTAVVLGFLDHSVILPADIYPARLAQASSYGGKVLVSPPGEGEWGYIQMLERLIREDAIGKGRIGRDRTRSVPVTNAHHVPDAPYERLLQEVRTQLRQLHLPDVIDTFLFGVGSGNTVSHLGRLIRKSQDRPVEVVVVEFAECPFVARLQRGEPVPSAGGWPAGDMGGTIYGVPAEKLALDLRVIDRVVSLTESERVEGRAIVNDGLRLYAGRPTGMFPVALAKLSAGYNSGTTQLLSIVFDSVAKYATSYDPVCNLQWAEGGVIRGHRAPILSSAEQERRQARLA